MKWRKKSVVVDAYRPYYNEEPTPDWFLDMLESGRIVESLGGGFDIETLEGTMHARIGDYIIKGIHGEPYPCKPDIFWDTYKQVHYNF